MEAPLEDRDADGVDLTLVRWMLSLTPEERLDMLDNYVRDIVEIREQNGR